MDNNEQSFRLWREAVDLQIKALQLEKLGMDWLAKLYRKLTEVICVHLQGYKDPLD